VSKWRSSAGRRRNERARRCAGGTGAGLRHGAGGGAGFAGINMKRAATLALLSVSLVASAETLNFHCHGVLRGDDIVDSSTDFEITVDTVSGEIYGFPGFVAPGCMDVNTTGKKKSSIDERHAESTCNSTLGTDIVMSIVTLSRLTANLSISTVFVDEHKKTKLWNGNFACQKIFKNVF